MTLTLVALAGILVGAALYHFFNQKLLVSHELLKERLALQEKYHQEASDKLELKLQDFSHKMFQEKSRVFREDSLKGMELLLSPFREKMSEFSRKVEDMHLSDTKDRLKLHAEIERIALTGKKMSEETENLTRALKGDVKVQGSWGEMILEKILESSGLRKGEEFILQGKDLKLKDEEGKHQMPDAIINLPDQKHLVIDSKVSLIAYERYMNHQQPHDLSAFLNSLYAHIKGLSGKRYHTLEKISSPEYVMLFIPIEGAFMLAMKEDKELFTHAWENNIVLVCPSTLLATLRTVASIWKQERQTKNALEIARQAGALYDKFVAVANEIDFIQAQFKKVNDSFDGLKSRMLTGKGSVASRMENLRELGAKTSKQLEDTGHQKLTAV